MNTILSNGKLYIFDKEAQVITEEAIKYYVPIDSLNDYKALNPDKPIEGYNYNTIRVTNPEYYDVDVVKINCTTQNVDNMLRTGMYVKEFQIINRKFPANFTMFSLPFEVSVSELKGIFGNDAYFFSKFEIDNLYHPRNLQTPTFTYDRNNTGIIQSKHISDPNSVWIRFIANPEKQKDDSYFFKANKPILMSATSNHSVTPTSEPIKFYNKKLVVPDSYICEKIPNEKFDCYWLLNPSSKYQFTPSEFLYWNKYMFVVTNSNTGAFAVNSKSTAVNLQMTAAFLIFDIDQCAKHSQPANIEEINN